MITVGWVKCGQWGKLCRLETVDLSSARTAGVYVILARRPPRKGGEGWSRRYHRSFDGAPRGP